MSKLWQKFHLDFADITYHRDFVDIIYHMDFVDVTYHRDFVDIIYKSLHSHFVSKFLIVGITCIWLCIE